MADRVACALEQLLMNVRMPSAAAELLQSALQCMRYAERVADANLRFSLAHRSALRCVAAVLAVSASAAPIGAGSAMSRPQNAWMLARTVAPELSEWADYYASATPMRQAAESGSPVITDRMADDAVRDASQFMWEVAAVVARVAHRPGVLQSHAG